MNKSLVAAALIVAGLATSPAHAIVNGSPDTEHPYVGVMVGLDPGGTQRACSGSLIDEGVFLTAGHCTRLSSVTVKFGADISSPDHQFVATEVIGHPQFNRSFGKQYDVGVVLFDQGSTVLPVGQLAPADYVDDFTKEQLRAATFETIGYGLTRPDTNGNSEPLTPTTIRMHAEQSYLNKHNQYLGLSVNNNRGDGGGCSGDSGGPHLLNGLIVSVTSNGDANCVTTDNTQRVDQTEIRDWVISHVD
jgi:secreted trypsin-like serine protease